MRIGFSMTNLLRDDSHYHCNLRLPSHSHYDPVTQQVFDSGTETDDDEPCYSDSGEETSGVQRIGAGPRLTTSSSSMESVESDSRSSLTPVQGLKALELSSRGAGRVVPNETTTVGPAQMPFQPNHGRSSTCDDETANFQGPNHRTFDQLVSQINRHPGFRHYVRISLSAASENDGDHSSEEELEEINSQVEAEPKLALISQAKRTPDCSSVAPADSDKSMLTISATEPPIPVQFSTSPPTGTHVYKPRRSMSPPAKIFAGLMHASDQETGKPYLRRTDTEDPSRLSRDRRAISPRKRYKQSRIRHIQRPCLDFEKMQQLKARPVSTWHHGGGELSLFCW